MRAQKKLASRAATSGGGKRVLRRLLPSSVFVVFDEWKLLANADSGTPRGFGQRQTDILLKVGVKLAVLHENGMLKAADFDSAQAHVLRLSRQVMRKWDHLGSDPGHAKLLHAAKLLHEEVRRLLRAGQIKEESVHAVDQIFVHWCDGAVIERVLAAPVCREHIGRIVAAMRNTVG